MHTDHRLSPVASASDLHQFLEDRLYEFNSDQVGRDDGKGFGFVIRDAMDEILAGVSGWTWAGACKIEDLWVHPAWRGQGYGHDLLLAAEQEARSRGCQVILLDSYSFQAPAFYQKHGYELAWRLDDFPPGHSWSHLVKRLA